MAKEQLIERTLDMMDETELVPLKDVGIDMCLGSGFPTACISEIYGQEASGKTTITFEIMKAFLRKFPKKFAYYFNYERSIDKFYVRTLFENDQDIIKRFKIVDPIYLEDGMEYLFQVLDADTASICVIDSLAAMTPKEEAEKSLDKAQVGGFKAKAMAEVCRKIGTRLGSGCKTAVVFINHVNPVLGGFSFVPQKETPGGKAVKFWASLRVLVSVQERLYKEEALVGTNKKEKIPFCNVVKLTVEKNKFYPPYKRGIGYIELGKGLNRALSLIDYGLQIGIIGLAGKTDYYLSGKEENKIRGKQKFADLINSKPALMNWLYERVAAYIAEKRAEAKNINLDSLTKDSGYANISEENLVPQKSETEKMFDSLVVEAADNGREDDDDSEVYVGDEGVGGYEEPEASIDDI